jgi:succinate dehydrogenase/fumarate reductase cytochrome b subunit
MSTSYLNRQTIRQTRALLHINITSPHRHKHAPPSSHAHTLMHLYQCVLGLLGWRLFPSLVISTCHLPCSVLWFTLPFMYISCLLLCFTAVPLAAATLLVLPGDFASYMLYIKDLQINSALLTAAKYVLAFPVCYHYVNGIRHLVRFYHYCSI